MTHGLDALVPGLTLTEVARPGRRHGRRDRGQPPRRLRLLTAGRGDPPVLLVAGAGETALDWLPILGQVAALSTVVALDRAGLGSSDPAPGVSALSQVDDLAAVLAEIGPAVVVGHSWGGLLVQLLAWQHPSAIRGMVLVDPSHEELFAVTPWHLRVAAAAMAPALSLLHRVGIFHRLARPMARRLAMVSTTEPALQPVVEAAYLHAYRERRQARMIGVENRLGFGEVPRIRQARSSLPDVPVVVLTATTGKPPALQRVSTRLLAQLAADAPRAELVVVAESGHYIHHDQPAVVVETIATVLAAARVTLR
jgi:pimeloyl-ACP methyl ester carboxylesterase